MCCISDLSKAAAETLRLVSAAAQTHLCSRTHKSPDILAPVLRMAAALNVSKALHPLVTMLTYTWLQTQGSQPNGVCALQHDSQDCTVQSCTYSAELLHCICLLRFCLYHLTLPSCTVTTCFAAGASSWTLY